MKYCMLIALLSLVSFTPLLCMKNDSSEKLEPLLKQKWSDVRQEILHVLHNEKQEPYSEKIRPLLIRTCTEDDAQVLEALIDSGYKPGFQASRQALSFSRSLHVAYRLKECNSFDHFNIYDYMGRHLAFADPPLLKKLCAFINVDANDVHGDTVLHNFLRSCSDKSTGNTSDSILKKTCVLLTHKVEPGTYKARLTRYNNVLQTPLDLLSEDYPLLAQKIAWLTPAQTREIAQKAIRKDPKRLHHAQRGSELRSMLDTHIHPPLTSLVLGYGGVFTPLPPYEPQEEKKEEDAPTKTSPPMLNEDTVPAVDDVRDNSGLHRLCVIS